MRYKNNAAVAIIFFNRPDTLEQVFAAVRDEKPKKLFLIQDGPRDGNLSDVENVAKCRKVVENVDWDCEVIRDYSDVNLGCGMRVYTGVTNAFKTEDRLIIIEDDIVTTPDFFRFCNEMLEYYKDDTRVHRVAGMCHMGEYKKSPYSYGFTDVTSCWGWATWKRVWDDMDYSMSFMDNSYVMNCFISNARYKREAKSLVKTGKERKKILDKGGSLSAWTFQYDMSNFLNNRLGITPTKNLISCIGLNSESVHASNSINKISKGLQKVFYGKTYYMDFPIEHPPCVIEDVEMSLAIRRVLGWTPVLKITRKIEGVTRRIIFADKGDIKKMVKKIIHR